MPRFLFPILFGSWLILGVPISFATTISGGDQVIETEPTPTPAFAEDPTPTPRPEPVTPLPTIPNATPATDLNLGKPIDETSDAPATPTPSRLVDAYTSTMQSASDLFRKREFDEALARLEEADKLKPGAADIINFRGAIYAEKGQFAEAQALYEQAMKQNPESFWPRYNLCEIEFMQKKYTEARTQFTAMLEKYPANELLQFKIILTYLLEKNESAAKSDLEKFHFPSNTSAYYFAWAAWEFSQGHTKEGNDWVASGTRIFGREKTDFVYQSLGDLKWVPMPRP